MRTAKVFLGAVVVALGVAALGSLAFASMPNPSCVKGARQDKHDCLSGCQDDFQISKDGCRDVDHQCAETCRAQFHDCRAPLQTCIDGCNTDLRNNITNSCPPPGDPGRDSCIDGFQISAFVCRDNCRETNHGAVQACRKARKDCVVACPPPPTPTPAP